MTILVTGAAGFIGSHVCRVAVDAGHHVTAIDDLSTSRSWPALPRSLERVEGDVGDRALVERVVRESGVRTVIHLAGLIRVDESFERPERYLVQNAGRTASLLEAIASAARAPVAFVLSSSAAVYGEGAPLEGEATLPISPYGASKLAAELVVQSVARARGFAWAALRYFNAAGAHPDGTLRERHEPETHLIPSAIDAVLGRAPPIEVYGDQYRTRDGTALRDYVHVMDLAEAHLSAVERLGRGQRVGPVNLGSGVGTTVREVLDEVGRVAGATVPHAVAPARPGDPPRLVAEIGRAAAVLDWQPRRGLRTIVEDAVRSRAACPCPKFAGPLNSW